MRVPSSPKESVPQFGYENKIENCLWVISFELYNWWIIEFSSLISWEKPKEWIFDSSSVFINTLYNLNKIIKIIFF